MLLVFPRKAQPLYTPSVPNDSVGRYEPNLPLPTHAVYSARLDKLSAFEGSTEPTGAKRGKLSGRSIGPDGLVQVQRIRCQGEEKHAKQSEHDTDGWP